MAIRYGDDMEKKCSKCGSLKTLDQFGARKNRASGYQSECRKCARDNAKKWQKENQERIIEYNRKRYEKFPEISQGYRLRNLERHREYARKSYAKTLLECPEKLRARSKVAWAVRTGKLVRPESCSSCSNMGKRIEAHHEDYSRPYDVVWLCPKCHRRA